MQDRLDARPRRRGGEGRVELARTRQLRRRRARVPGQSVHLGLGEREHRLLLVAEHVLRKLGRQHRQPLDDLGKARPFGDAQLRAGAHEIEMIALQHPRRFRIEAQPVALPVELVDAPEQRRVEKDAVPVPRHHRRHVALHRLQLGIGVGARQLREHHVHLAQQLAAELQRRDGVVEARRFGIAGNRRHLPVVLGQRPLVGRCEMRRFDRLERRHAERRVPGGKEWIGHRHVLKSRPKRHAGSALIGIGRSGCQQKGRLASRPSTRSMRYAAVAGVTGSPSSSGTSSSPASPASTLTVWPSWMSPARIASASRSCTSRWMTRFSGRAP